MITFFRTETCPQCDAIQETLEELTLAHKVVRSSPEGQPQEGIPEGCGPPSLMDDDHCVRGHRAIVNRLEEWRAFRADWDRFQSDACYCDDEGNPI